jgi:hypothetical protein
VINECYGCEYHFCFDLWGAESRLLTVLKLLIFFIFILNWCDFFKLYNAVCIGEREVVVKLYNSVYTGESEVVLKVYMQFILGKGK